MCIIAYVKSGKDVSDERIRFMFKGNPDGAGLMWKPTPTSDVEIRKGFMNVEELISAYRSIPTQCERAIHMRIATAGKVSVDCCHPFPVRKNVDLMRKAVDRTDVALMHNGVISYCQPKGGINATYSDSMLFACKYLYHFKNILGDELLRNLFGESTPSRLLIMRKGEPTIMVGSWKSDEDGVMYSNANYKPVEYVYYGGYGSYDFGYGGGYYWDASTKSYKKNSSQKKGANPATNEDATTNEAITFDLDVEQYFNEEVAKGRCYDEISYEVEEFIWDDILSISYYGTMEADIEDIFWLDEGKIVTVRAKGLPVYTKSIAGFDVVAVVK